MLMEHQPKITLERLLTIQLVEIICMKDIAIKKTGNIKDNIMRNLRELFPKQINPFMGGLGNRENDASAYLVVGIPLGSIYITDNKSEVQRMSTCQQGLTFIQMAKNIDDYFPKYNSPKIGYK